MSQPLLPFLIVHGGTRSDAEGAGQKMAIPLFQVLEVSALPVAVGHLLYLTEEGVYDLALVLGVVTCSAQYRIQCLHLL